MYLESQTQFGDIPWPRQRSAGVFLNPAQSMAHRVGMADKHFGGATHRCVVVLPRVERFEQHLALVVGKIAKPAQRTPDRFHHHLGSDDCSSAKNRAVEHRDWRGLVKSAPQHHLGEMESIWRIAQILEPRTDPDTLTVTVLINVLGDVGEAAADVVVGPGPTNYTVQTQPEPGTCHYRTAANGQTLPDPNCTPGAISPKVT